jgi:hypothetical protein
LHKAVSSQRRPDVPAFEWPFLRQPGRQAARVLDAALRPRLTTGMPFSERASAGARRPARAVPYGAAVIVSWRITQ